MITTLGGAGRRVCASRGAVMAATEVVRNWRREADGNGNDIVSTISQRHCVVPCLNMLTRIPLTTLLLLSAVPLLAQNSWFQPSLLEKPEVRKAMQSVDERATGIVDEWIRLIEIPSPSGKEQARAKYMHA